MLKKIKELLGFPTEKEKEAAKQPEAKVFVDGHGDAREVVTVLPFTISEKPEQETVKPKAKKTPKPKAETATKAKRTSSLKVKTATKPLQKEPAAVKKPTTKKPAAKVKKVKAE
jgi:hypothetical protein